MSTPADKTKCDLCHRTVLLKNMPKHLEIHAKGPQKKPKEPKTLDDVVQTLEAIYGEVRNIYELMFEELRIDDDAEGDVEALEDDERDEKDPTVTPSGPVVTEQKQQ